MIRPNFWQNVEVLCCAIILCLTCIVFAGGLVTTMVLLAIRLERLTLLSFHWALTRSTMILIFLVVITSAINMIYNGLYLKPGTPHTDFFFGEEFNSQRRAPSSPSLPSAPSEALPVEPADRPSSLVPDTSASEYEAESESSANEADTRSNRRIPVAQVVRPRMVALNVALSPLPANHYPRPPPQREREAGVAT